MRYTKIYKFIIIIIVIIISIIIIIMAVVHIWLQLFKRWIALSTG